ncbi:serine hydrolase domain-containing protein [Microbulbifer sp. SSSA007]|uniref:serine hydrolase domain-containing protein n=1 Tax=Microbulbifer TaxID=48073 RepID=UPI00037F52A8|nr:serine hydrolase domain-containing protein [Microbulbifer variabilis]
MPKNLKSRRRSGIYFIAWSAALILVVGYVSPSFAKTEVTLNDFYRPFDLSEINQNNMQSWPYYRYTSMHWDEYGIFGTVHIMEAEKPAKLEVVKEPFNISLDIRKGWPFVESLTATQTKGFLIMKDNQIIGEFYDNGLDHNQTQLLQSSSKTYAGVIISKLIDEGKIDPNQSIESYLPDFAGSKIGKAKVQEVLDMTSGLLPATDYHVPGGEAFLFEIEQGLKPGKPTGHRNAIRNAKVQNKPGEVYTYNDKNTDLLAILAEEVSGHPFNKLLSDLFNDFGANSSGSIALTVDGTASPSYGISTTLRDYALFHQWIAQGKAPKSFYDSVKNLDKDLLGKSESGKSLANALGTPVAYGSQAWYLPEYNVIYTAGSYGQYGFSDLNSGMSVVFMQDWEDNAVPPKLVETVERAKFLINQLGKQNDS